MKAPVLPCSQTIFKRLLDRQTDRQTDRGRVGEGRVTEEDRRKTGTEMNPNPKHASHPSRGKRGPGNVKRSNLPVDGHYKALRYTD